MTRCDYCIDPKGSQYEGYDKTDRKKQKSKQYACETCKQFIKVVAELSPSKAKPTQEQGYQAGTLF